MKAEILKISKCKDEKSFYKKYPSEKAFMDAHGKEFKKAMLGAKITTAQGGLKMPSMQSVQGMPSQLGYNLSGDMSKPMFNIGAGSEGMQQLGSSSTQQLASMVPSNNKIEPIQKKGLAKLKESLDPMAQVVKGIQAIKKEKEDRIKAEQWNQVSDITRQASETQDVDINSQIHDNMNKKREAMMPVNTGEEFYPIYGAGTNPLAKNGKTVKGKRSKGEIMNVGSPDMPIAAGGFSAFLNAGGKDAIGNSTNYLYGNNAGSQVGGQIGGAIGNIWGPVGSLVGQEVGKIAGWAIDRNPAKMKRAQDSMNQNLNMMGMNNGMKGVQGQYTSFMEDGGYVSNNWTPQVITKFGDHKLSDLLQPDDMMNTLRTGGNIRQNSPDMQQSGELQTHWGGHAEPIAYNPYLPDGGEMIEFKGNTHEQSNGNGRTGIGITFGKSPVEVETGEPAVKLDNGGESLTVFGNMPITKIGASIIGDPDAANKKFKGYANNLAAKTNKVNKLIENSTKQISDIEPVTSFDKLKLNSFRANLLGADMQHKDFAEKTKNLADYQQAINDTAQEQGLVAEELAKGKIKQAKKGTTISAQGGIKIVTNDDFNNQQYSPEELLVNRILTNMQNENRGLPSVNLPIEPIMQEEISRKTNKSDDDSSSSDVKSPSKKAVVANTKKGVSKSIPTQITPKDNTANYPLHNNPYLELLSKNNDNPYNSYIFNTPKTVASNNFRMPGAINPLSTVASNKPVINDSPDNENSGTDDKYWWLNAMNSMVPYFRPSDAEQLDPRQLSGEMYAMSNNQIQPVQAQTYQPRLKSAYDISLQDQLNEVHAQTRAAEKMVGYNPAAQAAIAGQAYSPESKILAEQFRMNQGMKDQTYNQNLSTLNDAQLKNLGIFDNQYQRQEQAKSNTKATTQATLSSVAAKYMQNQTEQRQLQTMENMYGYRFGPGMRAWNWNQPAQFNVEGSNTASNSSGIIRNDKGEDLVPVYDHSGRNIESYRVREAPKAKTNSKARNGSIVHAFRNL